MKLNLAYDGDTACFKVVHSEKDIRSGKHQLEILPKGNFMWACPSHDHCAVTRNE